MTQRIFIGTVILLVSVTHQAAAEGMPKEIKTALHRIVGKWKMETVVDGETTHSEVEVKWTANESVLVFHWAGTDFDTGKQNSGTGMLGWDAFRQLVVEHELDKDGASFNSTHQINGDKWVSPTKGVIVDNGKAKYTEAHRVFTFASKDEFVVIAGDRVVGGKPVPDVVSTFRRQ